MNARHLYIHIPFCVRRCTYCDFSIAVRRTVPVAEYLDALRAELALWALRGRAACDPRGLETLYLGGGTPSRLGGDGIAALVRLLEPPARLVEFTLEANPEDVTPEAVSAWVRAGVNRLSIGAQSFDARALGWMHRSRDTSSIRRAVRAAREAGIRSVSLDLIFALPDAVPRDWRADLDAALAVDPDHIALYGLTVETGTALARQLARGAVAAAPDSRWEDEYLLAHSRLTAHGFTFYEVSNAARPGHEAVHNRAYWSLAPYLGAGPSAHSFDGAARWWNERAYAAWRDRLAAGLSPVAGREILRDRERRLEELYLGLRTARGVALPDPLPPRLAHVMPRWVAAGWAEVVEAGAGAQALGGPEGIPATERTGLSRLRLTPTGWLRLDELVASF